jgi:hypothetical protein
MTTIKINLPRFFSGNIDMTPALLRLGDALRDKTNVYPPRKHGMKMRWKSERQKRYVMANVALPYARQGWLSKRWRVTPVSPTRVVVRNAAEYAAFVIGRAQQPFHRDRGWRRIDEQIESVARDPAVMREVRELLLRAIRDRAIKR